MNTSPLLYHIHHEQEADDLPFWLDWAQRQGGPILELGCGSGRVILTLAQAGHNIVGVDHDPGMLSFLRKRAQAQQLDEVEIVQADMKNFCLAQRFALILVPCNTFSTLRPDEQLATVEQNREHLASGGIFIASMPNPHLLTILPQQGEIQEESSFRHPLSGYPVQVLSQWERTQTGVTFWWHYDHLLPNGRVERNTMSAEHFLRETGEIVGTFEQAGLAIDATYGDYDCTPHGAETPYLIVVSRR